ncbi:MAG: pentapeptide repeat-containing protein, partial [Myxococcota bacterium]|nr:pentapeptide repeat-containing protein [Myxococcota bacterium]
MIRPAHLRLIRTLLKTGLLMLLVCGLASCGEETTPIPAPLRIASAEAGETIIVEDETIRTTLVIPPGVSVTGIQGQETLIEPEEGQPGLVLQGSGASAIRHLKIRNATGAGVRVDGRSIVLENIEISGTRRTTAEEGHGVDIRNADSLVVVAVSSQNNEGDGLHIEETDNITIVDPSFVNVPDELMAEASRVIIHPSFMPIDEESVSIIHPSFVPQDGDGVSIIHPSFIPDVEDHVVIIDPIQFGGEQYSGNGGDGISIIHPSFIVDPEGPDEPPERTDAIPTFIEDTNANQVVIAGVKTSDNGGAGLRLNGAMSMSLQYLVSTKNAVGIAVDQGSLSVNATYVADNSGTGVLCTNGTMQLASDLSTVAWPGTPSDAVGIIHPSFIDDDGISIIHPSFAEVVDNDGSPTDGISIIHPSFMPVLTVENNGGDGVLVAPVTPPELNAGKADGHTDAVVLDGAWIRGNRGAGIRTECGDMTIRNSLVTRTKAGDGYLSGIGISAKPGEACSQSLPVVAVDKGSLIAGNDGGGVLAQNGARIEMQGAILLNKGPGVVTVGASSTVQIGTAADAACQASGAGPLECRPPLIAYNAGLGISAGPDTVVSLQGARVQNTVPIVANSEAMFDLGYGLWSHGATINVTSSDIVDNAVAGVVLHGDQADDSTSIMHSHFSGSSYGVIRLKPSTMPADEAQLGTPIAMPSYADGMMESCDYDASVIHPFEMMGCLPEPGQCAPGQADACSANATCQQCTINCKKDTPCIAQMCSGSNRSGQEFAGHNYDGLDLTGYNFTGSNLTGASFEGTNLTGAQFGGATLTGVNFTNATLSNTDFTDANLQGATMAGLDLSSATLTGVKYPKLTGECPISLPPQWLCQSGYLWGQGASYIGYNFEGMEFTQSEPGQSFHLDSVNISNAKNVTFTALSSQFNAPNVLASEALNVTFQSTEMWAPSNFENAEFSYATGLTVRLLNASEPSESTAIIFKSATLEFGTDITLETAPGGDWSQASFDGTTFTVFRTGVGWVQGSESPLTNMTGITFAGTDFPTDYQFSGVDMTGASFILAGLDTTPDSNAMEAATTGFQDVILQGADFQDATLQFVAFNSVDLTGAYFTNTNLSNVNWNGAICPSGVSADANEGTCCGAAMNGTPPAKGCAVYQAGENLQDADFAGQNLTDGDFSGADLTNANLAGADLSHADLSGANVTGANFQGATLFGANLAGTDLSSAVLTGIVNPKLGAETCPAALPTDWWCQDGYLWGPSVVYDQFDFAGKSFNFNELNMNFPLNSAILSGAKNLSISVLNSPGIDAYLLDMASAENITITTQGCTQALNFELSDFQNSKQVTLDLGLSSTSPDASINFKQAIGVQADTMVLKTYSGNSDWTGANFSNATFTEFKIGLSATGGIATMSNTTFDQAALGDYLLNGVQMENVSFDSAVMSCLENANCTTIFGPDTVFGTTNGIVSFDGAVMVGVVIQNQNLAHADFQNANLTNASLAGSTLMGTDLKSATLTGADLTNADLSGSMLTNTNFTGATLTEVTFGDIDLSTTTLTGVIMPILIGCPAALPVDWMCSPDGPYDAGYTYLWGPEVNYSGFNFSNHAGSPDPNVTATELTISFDASQGDNLNLNGANLSNIRGLTLVANEIGLTATSLNAVGAENFTLRTILTVVGTAGCVADTAQNGICDGTVSDLDGDGWFNEVETLCGTDPSNAASNPPTNGLDIDNDKLCDAVDLDDDGDGWSDQAEIFCQSNPNDPSSLPTDLNNDGFCDIYALDADGDDWPDAYETECGTDINDSANNPTADGQDIDSDKLCDLLDADDDGDGWPDDLEVVCETNPSDPSSVPLDSDADASCDLLPYPDADPDMDGFENEYEAICGSHPLLAEDIPVDTDYNGICDAVEPVGNPAAVIDYTGADFTGSTAVSLDHDVTSVGAPGVTLTGANFTGAQALSIMTRNPTLGNWENTTFDNAVITELSTGIASDATTLGSTPGSAVVLTGTSFDSAVLNSASFMYSDLTGVDFTDASVINTNWKSAICPSGLASEQNGRTCCGALNEVSVAYGCGESYVGDDLSGASFTGEDLTFANFFNATFDSPDFTNTDLTGATFVGADLSGASFVDATLIGADFFTATLNNANFTGIDLTGATFEGADLTGADFSGADLTNTNFTGADLTGADFSGANLTNTNFTDADLSCVGDVAGVCFTCVGDVSDPLCPKGANFSGANLTGTNLTGANLRDVSSGGITGTPAALPADWTLVNGYLMGPRANLADANLSNADLQDVNLQSANLTGAHLTEANLTGADLAGAYLMESDCTNADFTNASLVAALFKDADLTNALLINISANTVDFGNTNLSGADLTGADLLGAAFFGADLTGTDLSGATLTHVMSANNTGTPLALPTDYFMVSGYIIGPEVWLEGELLSGLDLSGANLEDANFYGSSLNDADLSATNLSNADLSFTLLWSVNLSDAGLAGAYLYGAALDNADLSGANLTDADLSNAVLTNVTSGGITGTPSALPTGWTLTHGYLVGPGANLSGADLSYTDLQNVNLTGAVLQGANLTGADLTDADLTGVTSGNITGTPTALPTDWILINGYLIGPGANVSGVNLSGKDLSGTNLTGTDLTNADLTGTAFTAATLSNSNLTGANLTDADLTSANLTGAALTNTDFTNAELLQSNLEGVDLSTAILSGVWHPKLGAGCPAQMPAGWVCMTDCQLVDTTANGFIPTCAVSSTSNAHYLFGPSVNYAGYNFAEDTPEVKLTFATLTVGAVLNLENANFDAAMNLEMHFPCSPVRAESLSAVGATNLAFTSAGVLPSNVCPFMMSSDLSANYTGADFSNSDSVTLEHINNDLNNEAPTATLANADFTNAQNLIIRVRGDWTGNWTNATFDSAVFTGLSVHSGGFDPCDGLYSVDMQGSSMQSANLALADIACSNLTNTDFTGADLTNADLTDAGLTGVISGNITGTPAVLPTDW